MADPTKEISADYGVLIPSLGVALRGLFIINPEGVLEQVTHGGSLASKVVRMTGCPLSSVVYRFVFFFLVFGEKPICCGVKVASCFGGREKGGEKKKVSSRSLL